VFEHSFLMLGTCSNRPVKTLRKSKFHHAGLVPASPGGKNIPSPLTGDACKDAGGRATQEAKAEGQGGDYRWHEIFNPHLSPPPARRRKWSCLPSDTYCQIESESIQI